MTALESRRRVQRELANLRGLVRRTGLTGRNARSAALAYGRATEAVLRYEDAAGIDAAAPFTDRLTALRDEARSAGLLTDREVLEADVRAVEKIDAGV